MTHEDAGRPHPYAGAAEEITKSKWNSQTPVRVKDFQKALLALPQKKGRVPSRRRQS